MSSGALSFDSESSSEHSLTAQYERVRAQTMALIEDLSAEDMLLQSMPDASPTKWHLAHTTWFFETFLLQPYLSGYKPYDEAYQYLFNSYYETVGERHPRPQRGCSRDRHWMRFLLTATM